MPERRFGLRSLLALLVLATALPIAVYSAYLFWRSWQQQLAVFDRQNIELARAISVAVEQEVDAAATALATLATLEPTRPEDPATVAALREKTLRLMAQQANWHAVVLADARGGVIFDTADATPQPRTAPGSAGEAAARALATGRAAVSDLYRAADGEPIVAVAVPIARDRAAAAALVAELRPAALGLALRRQTVPGNGVARLLDANQRLLASSRDGERELGRPAAEELARAARSGGERSWRSRDGGVPAHAALSRSPRTGWSVALEIPSRVIDRPMARSFNQMAAVGFGFLALGVLSALLYAGLLTRALAGGAAAANRLARGEPIEARRSRVAEIDDLGQRLSDAAGTLSRRLRERDQAARERAAALAAEQAARLESERDQARLAVTLSSIADAVIATDASGSVTMINPVAASLTGWSAAEAVGRPLVEVFRLVLEETHEPLPSPTEKVMRGGEPSLPGEATLVTRHGRDLPIDESAAPITSTEGEILGAVVVFRDVSERRRGERLRQQLLAQEQAARRRAEEAGRSKDEFIATVSHELRNPLNAILGWVRLLRDPALDERGRERALEVIERNTRLQAQLVDELLDTSRIVSGKLRLEMRPVDLQRVVSDALEAIRPTAEAKELRLDRDLSAGPVPIIGDPDRLQQILWNLLTNAVKFTPRGGAVCVRLVGSAPDALLEVSDSGTGIESDLLPHIFERFRQGASSAAREHGGLGIGLALVRHLVELHGGSVSATSPGPGAGAVFTVRLPLAAERAVLMRGGLEPGIEHEAAPRIDGVRALVVDDDGDTRELLATLLGGAGASVDTAAGAEEALAMVSSANPDVLVSDIAMPSATGYDLIAALRARPRPRPLPAIALTAYGRAEDRERALAAGFDLHLGKPVEPLALVRAVALLAERLPRA